MRNELRHVEFNNGESSLQHYHKYNMNNPIMKLRVIPMFKKKVLGYKLLSWNTSKMVTSLDMIMSGV